MRSTMADSPIQEMTMEELLSEEKRVARGQVVTGQIMKIEEEEIIVDVGYKTEGVIPKSEFQDITGELTVKLGDKVEVSVERMADSNGRLRHQGRGPHLRIHERCLDRARNGRSGNSHSHQAALHRQGDRPDQDIVRG